jgi:hypothetical protein
MNVVLEIHYAVAFLVVLCAVIFSWSSMGRRVMNGVVGLQLLVGLVAAAVMGARHVGMPPGIWLHILLALGALVAYIFARRIGDRAGGATTGLVLSVAGLICVLAAFALGLRLTTTGHM